MIPFYFFVSFTGISRANFHIKTNTSSEITQRLRATCLNHQGLHWNVHCVANVGLRKWLNLYKRSFKIYDLLVFLGILATALKLPVKIDKVTP